MTYEDHLLVCDACGTVLAKISSMMISMQDKSSGVEQRQNKLQIGTLDYETPEFLAACNTLSKIPVLPRVLKAYQDWWGTPMTEAKLLGNGIEITEDQLPDIYSILVGHCEKLEIKTPRLFFAYRNPLNDESEQAAFTFGSQEHPCIFMTSSVLDNFPADEISFILAHECGHIKGNHVIYGSICNILTYCGFRSLVSFDPIFGGFASLIQTPFLVWSRASEYSADICGLVCTWNIESACRALLRLSVGSQQLIDAIDIDSYLRQGLESKSFYAKWDSFFHQTHPYLVQRIIHLIEHSRLRMNIQVDSQFGVRDNYPNNIGISTKPLNQKKKTDLYCENCGFPLQEGSRCPICN